MPKNDAPTGRKTSKVYGRPADVPAASRAVRIVNRGPAGLLNRVEVPDAARDEHGRLNDLEALKRGAPKDNISPGLKSLVRRIAELSPDPLNARVHDERNLEAIMLSLLLYGQMKPLVVRRQGMMVVAGNGTMEAARRLGWTKLACNVKDMTDLEAAGYGVADNRTAELASWDFEVVRRVEAMLAEEGQGLAGWTAEEVAALRKAGEPPEAPGEFPEVGEGIDVEHICPRCGYAFSGGETRAANGEGG